MKIIRCAADGAGGNAASFCAYGNYVLFEECHSWGGPNRYVFRTSVYGVSLDDGNDAVYESIEEDYNCFYGNTGDRNVEDGVGAHSLTVADPLVSGLQHLVRVEQGSVLAEAGRDGAPIGPTILKRVGVSGTLYGEPGWDQVTDEDLWPFPNEAQICDDCRSFHKAPDEAYPGSPQRLPWLAVLLGAALEVRRRRRPLSQR